MTLSSKLPGAPDRPSRFPSLRVVDGQAASVTDAACEVEDRVRQLLERYPFVTHVSVADSRAHLDRVEGGSSVRCRVGIGDEGSVWVQVGWETGDTLRRDLIRTAIRSVEAELGRERLRAERAALWERYDAIHHRMIEKNRMAAIGTMAASVAHDIRSPLTVLVSNLSYIEDVLSEGPEPGDLEELHSVLEDNRMAVELIEGVLNSMRTFVAEGEGTNVVAVGPVVQSAARLTRWHFSKAKVELEIHVEGDPLIRGTAGELCQILVNLLSNAAEAAPTGSVVRLHARRLGDQTRIWVADEGPGIPPEQADLVFEPFHTSKATGMGLGLSIAREMARRHGGDLHLVKHAPPELRPAPRGACFVLWQPMDPASDLTPAG